MSLRDGPATERIIRMLAHCQPLVRDDDGVYCWICSANDDDPRANPAHADDCAWVEANDWLMWED